MYLYHNIEQKPIIDVTSIQAQNKCIQQMKKEFASFGYQEVHTPAFQPYDLYVQMNGTVNQQEMIKTIDNTGNVLVLRPDVTIPLTQRIATNRQQLSQELRYFYILDVFRQAQGTNNNQENAQIGAEYFGNGTAAADAEMIALSMNVLQSIDYNNVKVEIGHAGFFKELISEMRLGQEELTALKQFIRAKNVPEIDTMVQSVGMAEDLKEIITSLPFLYGKPDTVMEQTKKLPLTEAMRKTLDNITEICEYLSTYGLVEQVVIDLSLINHMDYYSDMIFQGFIEKVGKPVLMGGRYDTLAEQFEASFPAVGFACNLDLLMEHAEMPEAHEETLDACLLHTPVTTKQAIDLANDLRKNGFQTVLYSKDSKVDVPFCAKVVVHVNETDFVLEQKEAQNHYPSKETLVTSLKERLNR